jgi:membrane protease YdiL (CAAX protease family)
MAKSVYLAGWFLAGCIGSSLVAWFGLLHPTNTSRLAIAVYSLFTVAWVICWLADDAIAPYIRTHQINYYAALIGFAGAIALGGVATWLTF